jgi:hypothetical protein
MVERRVVSWQADMDYLVLGWSRVDAKGMIGKQDRQPVIFRAKGKSARYNTKVGGMCRCTKPSG